MWLWVPVHVETIGSILSKEQLFKECLELYFGKSGKHGNIRLLSIKLIAMCSKFEVPVALEFLAQVLVFLWDCSLDGIHNSSEVFFCHVLHFDPHLGQMYIKSLTNVQAVLCRRLDKEPTADDVAGAARAGEYNVT